jgi:hypothetical protein
VAETTNSISNISVHGKSPLRSMLTIFLFYTIGGVIEIVVNWRQEIFCPCQQNSNTVNIALTKLSSNLFDFCFTLPEFAIY